MQIVIDIDDKLYKRIKYLEPKADTMLDELMRAIKNGTPLNLSEYRQNLNAEIDAIIAKGEEK